MDFYYSSIVSVENVDGGITDNTPVDFHLKQTVVGDISIIGKKGVMQGTSFARSLALAELLAASKPVPNLFDRAVRDIVRRLKIDGKNVERKFEKDSIALEEVAQMTNFGVRVWRSSDSGKETEGSPRRLVFESSFGVPLEETFKRPIHVDVLCPSMNGHEYSVLLPVADFNHPRVRNLVWMSKMLNDAGKAQIIAILASFCYYRVFMDRVHPFYFVFESSQLFALELQYPPQALCDVPFITSKKYHQLIHKTVDDCNVILCRANVGRMVSCVSVMKKEGNGVYTVSDRIISDDLPDEVFTKLVAIMNRLDTWVKVQFPQQTLQQRVAVLSPAKKACDIMDSTPIVEEDKYAMLRDKLVECAELLSGDESVASRKLSGKLKKVQKYLSDRERSKLFGKDGRVDTGFLQELIEKYSSDLL